jgi:membrane fusion protein, multidrug efflux system
VNQGAALFRIEREPYEIALRQAEAELANARAADSQAGREWRRTSGLFEQNAVSERERDRALSEHELAQARLKLAEARVAEARLNLGYTTVVAPIAGPTGLESLIPRAA